MFTEFYQPLKVTNDVAFYNFKEGITELPSNYSDPFEFEDTPNVDDLETAVFYQMFQDSRFKVYTNGGYRWGSQEHICVKDLHTNETYEDLDVVHIKNIMKDYDFVTHICFMGYNLHIENNTPLYVPCTYRTTNTEHDRYLENNSH
jgi:hypothetical protein